MKRVFSLFLAVVVSSALILAAGINASAAAVYPSAGVVSTSSTKLNVRSAPSSSASIVTALPKGAYITLYDRTGSWWRVSYENGKYGYCHADYISPVSGSKAVQVATASGNLNVRQGAGTNYAVQATLAKGSTAVAVSTANGWTRILYHGTRIGYVSSQYLKTITETYPAIRLSIPDYKQTDPRWANVTLGNSGKTIRQIGCTTTALAMMESYRTGTVIYPNVMASKLNYSSSGDLYWPSDYVSNTNANQYLSSIYQLLQAGKPVLIGAKTSAGRQHWVVVTGFQGGQILSPSAFLVNDPGSNSTVNLQQFLNQYPNFYKIVYYR